jgi:transposase InsO family protein
MQMATPSGNRYMLTVIDDYSRFTYARLLTQKNQATKAIKDYVAVVSNLSERKSKILRTDNGKDYVNEELKQYLKKEGITH